MKELKELQEWISGYSGVATEIKEINGELRVFTDKSIGLANNQLTSLPPKHRFFKEGDYISGRYLYADGILTLVSGHRDLPNGIRYFKGKIKDFNVITDGTNFAHCKDIRTGMMDLAFKATNRDTSEFERYTLDSVLSVEDMYVCYRVITGACQQGTQNFVDKVENIKDEYSVAEVIEMTKGHFGHNTFRNFFEKSRAAAENS